MKINEKICTLRIRSRLTQNQTADFLDVTPSFIADVERNSRSYCGYGEQADGSLLYTS